MSELNHSGPHIISEDTIEKNMWGVVVALLPAVLAAWVLFGVYALYLAFASAISAVVFERPFVETNEVLKDGSAFLSGLLLGLTLPPGAPWWVPILGGALAMVLGKHLFGGLGNNIFNPALLSRALLLISFPRALTAWVEPFDTVSTATPLAPGQGDIDYLALFLGNTAGSIGATSILAILLGGIYLYYKGYIDLKIPFSFLGGGAVGALLFGLNPLGVVLSGGLMFAAIYMATDMVTSPVNRKAKIVYGFGGGLLAVFIGKFSPFPTGIAFAILFMNGISYLLDSLLEGPVFGEKMSVRQKYFKVGAVMIAVLLIGGFSLLGIREGVRDYPGTLTLSHLKTAFPQADDFEISHREEDDLLFAVYQQGEVNGYLAYISRQGGWGAIEKLISFNPEGEIVGSKVIEEREAASLGARIKSEEFLSQFEGYTPGQAEEIREDFNLISGATLSSLTVAGGMRDGLNMLANYLKEDKVTGEFRGTGSGARGEIEVEVSLEAGEIVKIKIIEHEDTADMAEPAFEELIEEVTTQQSLDVETVSGATNSSEGFLEAVQDALGDF